MVVCATGGPLNALNEKHKLNSRNKSVAVMQLVNFHKPQNPRKLKQLIESHYKGCCNCGIQSNGCLEQFALNLFNAQFIDKEFNHRFEYQKCYDFMYALFCESPLIGRTQEMKSRKLIQEEIHKKGFNMKTREATEYEDFDCAIDYVIYNTETNIDICGIQVKPLTCQKDIINMNIKKQKRVSFPTFFHYYNDDFTFEECEFLNFIEEKKI